MALRCDDSIRLYRSEGERPANSRKLPIPSIARVRATAVFAAVALGGCIPYRFTDEPGFRGTLVGGQQHLPVVGAKLTLSYGKAQFAETNHAETTSDGSGSFVFSPKRFWGVYVVPMDVFGYFGHIEIDAKGFLPKQIAVKSSPMGPADTDLGTILLEKAL